MAKGGKKYRLLMYEHMLSRWWPTTLALAFAVSAWGGATVYLSDPTHPFVKTDPLLSYDNGILLLEIGGVVLLFTIFLFLIRKMAYIQLFADHFKLATPFLRLNVSYKRILQTTTTQVSTLFPPKSVSGGQYEIIAPISGNTVIVIHLKSYPLPRAILKLFLSPLFFHDNTPNFVIMVDDWMGFSRDLESRRVGGGGPPSRKKKPALGLPSLLDDIRKK